MLRGENITVRYGAKVAVRQVSLSVSSGQWLMVCGPNGAGKSTLLKALAQTVPYTGQVYLGADNARSMKTAQFARKVGVLSQQNHLDYAFSVEELVSMGRYAHRKGIFFQVDTGGEAAVEQALRQTGLTALRRQNVLTLSGGELQRAFLAQVLAQEPQLLLLDEPANHLDLRFQQLLFDTIARWLAGGDRAVIAVVHDLSLARCYGTHALLMQEGRALAQGKMEQVLTPQALQTAYGMDVYAFMQTLLAPWEK